MKRFKLFKMLAVLIVLITSINTAWAYTLDYPVVYFDNASGTDWTYTQFFYFYSYSNGTKGSQGYALKKIDNTKLWCQYIEKYRGTDMNGFVYGFMDASGSWGDESGDNWSSRWET